MTSSNDHTRRSLSSRFRGRGGGGTVARVPRLPEFPAGDAPPVADFPLPSSASGLRLKRRDTAEDPLARLFNERATPNFESQFDEDGILYDGSHICDEVGEEMRSPTVYDEELDDGWESQSLTGSQGVRYITEELIKKIAKEEDLTQITHLTLTLVPREGGKKIRFIENLGKLRRLTILDLSYNIIERIQNIGHLIQLKELYLVGNRISSLNGLETLLRLQVLDLTDNCVESIPPWIKKLRCLRTLRLADNEIASISDVMRLKPLMDLVTLTLNGNPIYDIPHSQSFIINILPSLDDLDEEVIDPQMRENAQKRFQNEQLDQLQNHLSEIEKQLTNVQTQNENTTKTAHEAQKNEKRALEKEHEALAAKSLLEEELDAKNALLKRKTAELAAACEKHYHLEQELAFFKIDAKFDKLGREPSHPDTDESLASVAGESPYVGKGQFSEKRRQREKARRRLAEEFDKNTDNGTTAERTKHENVLDDMISRKKNELKDLEDSYRKRKDKLGTATTRLSQVEKRLDQAKKQIKLMGNGIEKLTGKSITGPRDLTHELQLQQKKVHDLRKDHEELQEEQEEREKIMKNLELRIRDMSEDHDRCNQGDLEYGRIKVQMENEEMQLMEERKHLAQTQEKLERNLAILIKESQKLQKLQQVFEEKSKGNTDDDDIKNELDSIITGLSEYLDRQQELELDQKKENSDQQQENARLQRELSELKNLSKSSETKIQTLTKELTDAKNVIEDVSKVNEDLKFKANQGNSQAQLETLQESWNQERKILRDRLNEAQSSEQIQRRRIEEDKKYLDEKNRDLTIQVQSLNHELSQYRFNQQKSQDDIVNIMNSIIYSTSDVAHPDVFARLQQPLQEPMKRLHQIVTEAKDECEKATRTKSELASLESTWKGEFAKSESAAKAIEEQLRVAVENSRVMKTKFEEEREEWKNRAANYEMELRRLKKEPNVPSPEGVVKSHSRETGTSGVFSSTDLPTEMENPGKERESAEMTAALSELRDQVAELKDRLMKRSQVGDRVVEQKDRRTRNDAKYRRGDERRDETPNPTSDSREDETDDGIRPEGDSRNRNKARSFKGRKLKSSRESMGSEKTRLYETEIEDLTLLIRQREKEIESLQTAMEKEKIERERHVDEDRQGSDLRRCQLCFDVIERWDAHAPECNGRHRGTVQSQTSLKSLPDLHPQYSSTPNVATNFIANRHVQKSHILTRAGDEMGSLAPSRGAPTTRVIVNVGSPIRKEEKIRPTRVYFDNDDDHGDNVGIEDNLPETIVRDFPVHHDPDEIKETLDIRGRGRTRDKENLAEKTRRKASNKRKLRMELEKKTERLRSIESDLNYRRRSLDRLLQEEAFLKANREGTRKSLKEINDALSLND